MKGGRARHRRHVRSRTSASGPGQALEALLPPQQGAGAHRVALCLQCQDLHLTRVRVTGRLLPGPVGADFMVRHRLHDVTETPGSVHGWLSAAVRWTSLEVLIAAWWDRQVLGADE